ncbi:hypothetical protein HDU82_008356 [Entophlyctis luteolus]|nr:hypothetical protein HDU82_008356 [Entophlyctis luteolus]
MTEGSVTPTRSSETQNATQDVISLQTKVDSLELALKVAKEKYATEKATLMQDMATKNTRIDKMRIKLSRYEFALKEAVLFLSKPMDAYESWLTTSRDSDSSNATIITELQRAISAVNPQYSSGPSFLGSIVTTSMPVSQCPTTPATPTYTAGRSRTVSMAPPARTGAASASSLSIVTTDNGVGGCNNSVLPTPVTAYIPPILNSSACGATNLEIHCLECMRLSHNYLKNAQNCIAAIDKETNFSENSAASLPHFLETSPAGERFAEDIANVKPLHEALADLKTIHENPKEHSESPQMPEKLRSNCSTAVAKSRALAYARLHSPERQQSLQVTDAALLRAATIVPISASSIYSAGLAESDDFDAGDIASTLTRSAIKQSTAPTSPSKQTPPQIISTRVCPGCRDLHLQIDQYRDAIDTLRTDVTTLANQLADERALRDRTQLAKDILDHELEELTSQLFDQANKMVADEARLRAELETSNRELQGELRELVARCDVREEELRELGKSLRAFEAAKLRSSVFSVHAGSTPGSLNGSLNAINAVGSGAFSGMFPTRINSAYYTTTGLLPASGSNKNNGDSIPVDGIYLREFQDHIRQALSAIISPTNPNPTPAAAVNETLFMKRCIIEDIEPCLFTAYPTLVSGPGGTYATSKLGKSTNGLLAMKRRLLDAFSKNQIEIRFAAESDSNYQLHSTISTPSTIQPVSVAKGKCISCTVTRECEYRLCICDKTAHGDMFHLCVFCRDRIAAVGDFYAYMGHLRQGVIGPGKQGMTLLVMLRHATWLRRRMAVARVGNCALFEPQSAVAAAERRGGDSEWEKLVNVVN